ncbi:MAG: FAD binding domain-containing protein, partial [Deltaproteobacteria bacterium]|nr:FAD binding domain-containing protein [Deltaproteobacteria bacterium]
MIPGAFDYYAPTSLEEALSLLSTHGQEAKLLAGGQSLVPLMKLRLSKP